MGQKPLKRDKKRHVVGERVGTVCIVYSAPGGKQQVMVLGKIVYRADIEAAAVLPRDRAGGLIEDLAAQG